MFVIVEIAGFQEKVQKGDTLKVALQDSELSKTLTFDKVMLVSDGNDVKIGTPYVAGASIEVKVLNHGKGDKVRVVKAHRRKRYRRVKGHRQDFTEVEVTTINA